MPVPEGPQFLEFHTVRGTPVRIFNPAENENLRGATVNVHLHTPATRALGAPIYSVLDKSKRLIGHTRDISLEGAHMAVDKKELENHLKSPTGAKTRNTFIRGSIAEPFDDGKPLHIRPGSITDKETGDDVSSNIGRVKLGPKGAFYRQ